MIYTAYPGEKPVLSGGRKVTGWQPYKGQIFSAALPGTRAASGSSAACSPTASCRSAPAGPTSTPRTRSTAAGRRPKGRPRRTASSAFRYKPGTFPHHWAKPTEGEVNIFFGNFDYFWGNDIIPIKSIDEAQRIITLVRPTRDFDRPSWFWPTPFQPDTPFVVENLLEELDQPGEWCLDSRGRQALLLAAGRVDRGRGGRGAGAGSPGRPAPHELRHHPRLHVHRDDRRRRAAPRRRRGPGGDVLRARALKYCGEALHLNRAEWCRVEDNHFDAVGGNAIYLQGYNARNVIRRNEIGLRRRQRHRPGRGDGLRRLPQRRGQPGASRTAPA